MREVGRYSLAAVVATVVLGGLLSLIFPGGAAGLALVVSAAVAVAVQVPLFAVVRFASTGSVMMLWAAGMLARFLVILVFAVIVAKGTQLEIGPALVGLATFFFACTLLEPLFLKK